MMSVVTKPPRNPSTPPQRPSSDSHSKKPHTPPQSHQSNPLTCQASKSLHTIPHARSSGAHDKSARDTEHHRAPVAVFNMEAHRAAPRYHTDLAPMPCHCYHSRPHANCVQAQPTHACQPAVTAPPIQPSTQHPHSTACKQSITRHKQHCMPAQRVKCRMHSKHTAADTKHYTDYYSVLQAAARYGCRSTDRQGQGDTKLKYLQGRSTVLLDIRPSSRHNLLHLHSHSAQQRSEQSSQALGHYCIKPHACRIHSQAVPHLLRQQDC